MHAVLRFDGGCRPTNPGVAAFAVIIEYDDGDTLEVSRPLGWRTNNYAEYSGLVVGLKLALDAGVTEIDVYTDSQLVCGHLTKGWRRNSDELRVLIGEAAKLLDKFNEYGLHWIPREQNTEADKLCGNTIAATQQSNPWRQA
jgi:ribonuclease HI